jgi:hypothetical protein
MAMPLAGRCRCKGAKPGIVVYEDDEPVPHVEGKTCERCGGIVEPIVVHIVHTTPEPLPDVRPSARR